MNKSYVKRLGRFTDAQKTAYEKLAPQFIVSVSNDPIELEKVFENSNPVTMEIGFGMGISTAIIAEANPDINYLCIEVHKPGIGKLLWEIEKRNLINIRIIEHDAVSVSEKMIAPAALRAIHLFFPDPWPKKRHRKRRLVQRPFTNILAACLKPAGYLYMVTDWEDYARRAMEELCATKGLKNAYDGFAPKQEWRPETKFEKKGLEKDHKIFELFFLKH